MEELDINKLSRGKSKNIKIGELSKEVINALGLDLNPQNINSGNLLFRTIFPISEIKLKNSLKSGKLIPFNKNKI